MGVTFIAPGEQFTSPARLITKEITEDGTYYAADDNANGYSSVEVSVGGGGGSSDFSTAEVTLTNGSQSLCEYVQCTEDGLVIHRIPQSELPEVYDMLLYNGCYILKLSSSVTAVVTGNAEVESSPLGTNIYITGDCTITIS